MGMGLPLFGVPRISLDFTQEVGRTLPGAGNDEVEWATHGNPPGAKPWSPNSQIFPKITGDSKNSFCFALCVVNVHVAFMSVWLSKKLIILDVALLISKLWTLFVGICLVRFDLIESTKVRA